VVRDAPGDRPHDVERVERRHARPRFGDSIRGYESQSRSVAAPTASRSSSRSACAAILLHGQPGAERLAHLLVEHHRVFVRLLRKHPLGQPGTKTTLNVRPRAWCGLPTNTDP
jgi:hypothetical protein